MRVSEFNMPIAVSAVVPVYNAALYIRATMESLQRQEELMEILIVDDGSNDSTCGIVADMARVDSRIKLCRLSSNQGVSAARNFGIQESGGDWILFFDGDDIADTKLLKSQIDHIRQLTHQRYENTVLVHSAYQQIDEYGNTIGESSRWKQTDRQETFGYLLLRNHIISASGVLVSKDALLEVGGFNQELRYAEDWDLWLRLAQKGYFGYLDEPFVFIRRHQNNASKSVEVMLEGEKQVLSQYSMEFIRTAIFQRNLSWEENAADYSGLLFRIGEWDRGYDILRDVVSRNPSFASGRFLMGLFCVKQQKWEEAQQNFALTLSVDERNGAALNNLGAILALRGQIGESLQYFQIAIGLFPGYLDASNNKEYIMKLQGSQCNFNNLCFTWRKLRPVLTSYSR